MLFLLIKKINIKKCIIMSSIILCSNIPTINNLIYNFDMNIEISHIITVIQKSMYYNYHNFLPDKSLFDTVSSIVLRDIKDYNNYFVFKNMILKDVEVHFEHKIKEMFIDLNNYIQKHAYLYDGIILFQIAAHEFNEIRNYIVNYLNEAKIISNYLGNNVEGKICLYDMNLFILIKTLEIVKSQLYLEIFNINNHELEKPFQIKKFIIKQLQQWIDHMFYNIAENILRREYNLNLLKYKNEAFWLNYIKKNTSLFIIANEKNKNLNEETTYFKDLNKFKAYFIKKLVELDKYTRNYFVEQEKIELRLIDIKQKSNVNTHVMPKKTFANVVKSNSLSSIDVKQANPNILIEAPRKPDDAKVDTYKTVSQFKNQKTHCPSDFNNDNKKFISVKQKKKKNIGVNQNKGDFKVTNFLELNPINLEQEASGLININQNVINNSNAAYCIKFIFSWSDLAEIYRKQ